MDYIALLAEKALVGMNLDQQENVCVLVKDGLIEAILPEDQYRQKNIENCREICLGDKTLMPGLIECHNHVTLDARLPEHLEMLATSSESKLTALAINALKDDLMSGVTTARSLADKYYIDVELKHLIQEGVVEGPKLLVGGMGMKGAHGHGYIGSDHSGAEEMRKTARANMKKGVDLLKVFVTPGNLSLTDDFVPSYLSLEEIRTVVEEGARLNIPTAAHCIGGQGLKDCLKAGVAVIEHMYAATEEDIELLSKSDSWVDLTSGIFLDPTREAHLSESNAYKFRMNREKVRRNLEKLVKAQIPFVLGTDAYHTYLYREVEYAVELGADKRYALQGVTSNAAKVCRISEKTGSLEAGKAADIIGVSGNPLENVSVLSDVSMVMKGGKIYKL